METPEKLNVVTLFQPSRRYVVPMYQRKYVWGADAQWEPLWRDIQKRAEAILLQGKKHTAQHFLGAIVVQPMETGMKKLPALTIIDGQQRLTTLQVFLAAFRNEAREVNEVVADVLQYLTRNMSMMTHDGIEDYKVWPSTFDREAFKAVMDSGSTNEVQEVVLETDRVWRARPRLAEAALFFQEEIRAWLHADEAHKVERAQALYDALEHALQLVVIKLDAADDAQVIFETLNARGVPLLPSDLVRNFIFLQAATNGEDTDALYERYWQEFDKEGIGDVGFWSVKESIGREKHPRFVAFLNHFLESRLGEELSMTSVFDAFRRWWTSADGPTSVEDGLKLLEKQSTLYRSLLQPNANTRVGVFAERVNILDYRTAYPLLLYLLTRHSNDPEVLDSVLTDLESWMLRRYVCRLVTRGYSQLFINLLQRLKSNPEQDAREVVRAFLTESTHEGRRWPSDDEFKRAWMREPTYKRLRKAGINMILRALDAALTNRYQETVLLLGNLSIEHVMPVEWGAHWPRPIPELATAEETAQDVRDRLVHTFGNLTLLTKPLNSKNSNQTYAIKRPLITEQSALRLNAYFQKQESWDDERIRERGERLFEVATRVWPVPEALAVVTDVLEESSGEGVRIVPVERLKELTLALKDVLPEGFFIGRSRNTFTWINRKGWPQEIHYEMHVKNGGVFIGVHCEFARHDPRREEARRRFAQLKVLVEEAFPDNEIEEVGYVYSQFNVRYSLAVPASELFDGLRNLVASTQEHVEQSVIALLDKKAA